MIFLQMAGVLVLLEIVFFVLVGSEVGVLGTILLCVLSAGGGIIIVQHQGYATLGRVQMALEQGLLPIDHLFDGLCLLLAGALLIFPGFLSDALAVLLLIPPVRKLIRRFIRRKYASEDAVMMDDNGVIEGEFIRVRTHDPDLPPPQ